MPKQPGGLAAALGTSLCQQCGGVRLAHRRFVDEAEEAVHPLCRQCQVWGAFGSEGERAPGSWAGRSTGQRSLLAALRPAARPTCATLHGRVPQQLQREGQGGSAQRGRPFSNQHAQQPSSKPCMERHRWRSVPHSGSGQAHRRDAMPCVPRVPDAKQLQRQRQVERRAKCDGYEREEHSLAACRAVERRSTEAGQGGCRWRRGSPDRTQAAVQQAAVQTQGSPDSHIHSASMSTSGPTSGTCGKAGHVAACSDGQRSERAACVLGAGRPAGRLTCEGPAGRGSMALAAPNTGRA